MSLMPKDTSTTKQGRPSKYQPSYCDELIHHMAQGYTLTSFGGVIGVHRDTLYEWASKHERFSDALKIGRAKGQLVWEQTLRAQALTNSGNTGAIVFAMKNLYRDDWRDKVETEVTGKDGGPIDMVSDRDVARKLALILSKEAGRGELERNMI